eukprot:1971451-Alexandrium_andersonii.AAC.1
MGPSSPAGGTFCAAGADLHRHRAHRQRLRALPRLLVHRPCRDSRDTFAEQSSFRDPTEENFVSDSTVIHASAFRQFEEPRRARRSRCPRTASPRLFPGPRRALLPSLLQGRLRAALLRERLRLPPRFHRQ